MGSDYGERLMNPLQRDLAGARRAHRQLEHDIEGLSDDQARGPSRLPNWTMGHVLTHIARNYKTAILALTHQLELLPHPLTQVNASYLRFHKLLNSNSREEIIWRKKTKPNDFK
jgi:hypothetical protein